MFDTLQFPRTTGDIRIVFEHTDGSYPGLLQIMGLTSDLGHSGEQPLPDWVEGFEALGRVILFASLVKVTRTYALYRELNTDNVPSRHFDKRQV